MKKILVLLLVGLTIICNADDKIKNLVPLKGKQYLAECNDLIASLNGKSKLDVSKYEKTLESLQARIIYARIKNPVIFENLRKEISNAKKTREYLREDTVHPMIDLALNTFVERKIEKKEYQKLESSTGNFGDLRMVKYTKTDEEVAKAKEFNQIADLARIEYLWKFAKEVKEIRETMPILYRKNIKNEKGIYIIAENILSKSEDAKTFQNAFHIEGIGYTKYNFKNIAKSALTRLQKNKKYDACIPVMDYLEGVGNQETQDMIKSLRPEILQKKAKVDKEKKEATKKLKLMRIKQAKQAQEKDQGLTLP